MVIPAVTVADQDIMDNMVIIAEVVSNGSGWLVIHAQADGKPGPVAGFSAVADGVNTDVKVEIDPAAATETLYAMLHTDAGTIGEYEFPGDDVPVKVDDQVVTPAFAVSGLAMKDSTTETMAIPAVTVADQEIMNNIVTIAKVISNGPGWLVIHAQAEGKPGPVAGFSAVADGVNTNVEVEIDLAAATETLYAMLHTDAGTIGEYEFPGDDVPVKVDDQVITPAFAVGGLATSMAEPSVTVATQSLAGGTVTIAEAISNGPGWLVIHAQADGKPGPVLGYSALADGFNADVQVALDVNGLTGVLYAMLHTDAGEVGAYEFPGDDIPVSNDQGVVMTLFELEVAEGQATVDVADFAFGPTELLVKAGTIVTFLHNDGGVGHTVTADDGSWDSGRFIGGEEFAYTFDQPGVYPYYCKPHGSPGGEGMAGSVIVLP